MHGTTVLLTSHYMADVEALCSRVVMIDGRILFDAPAELIPVSRDHRDLDIDSADLELR